ncbi:MAG: MoaD/ThiS family protein [Thermoproteales archaeon]|nr:MoaD/ThiS family protein [Thermoproteales archaeon]RLE66036.1 MAG: hypothetical protein DRJ47_03470 [Thermoprotei archaeon]
MVRVHFVGYLRDKVGTKSLEVRLQNPVKFRELIEKYIGGKVGEFIARKRKGLELDDLIVIVNGQSLDLMGGDEALIKNEDEIYILPNISGG